MISKAILSCIALAGLLLSATAHAAVTSTTVEYASNGQVFEGLLVTPAGPVQKRPLVLLIHNWMGISAETSKQAARFAELGYAVFAADIYGQGIRPQDAKAAGAQATLYKTDRALFRQRLNLALETALQQPGVNGEKVAVVGYCFGGTGALELARSGAELQAVVSFHGGLDSPAPADGKNITGQVLALHGADDPFVPAEDVAAFEAEMQANNIRYQLIRYPGAVHSFTELGAGSDNSKGAAYNAAADAQSFAEARQLLAATLQ
ncbi:dienelactone hydrolase family protein [Pseudomonas sp. N040]|uniref:dienelactone hydrolase family protein n=1 Tax=Pseudomonas sp. N040 TaxID=2785325 RepID=UPI0018A27932|nr:dienelactone hydrolase family protein [Pseudomonas sp. N040]MBF7731246.1 dienelactone hydrolase family protein [Pseudomonas sp. N040]MBW7014889.1 dienelactone hydrolase family protein [Pseudomonas sp. N040]